MNRSMDIISAMSIASRNRRNRPYYKNWNNFNMTYSRITLLFFCYMSLNLAAQIDQKRIYKDLIYHNQSLYDIKDSTVFTQYILYDRLTNDSSFGSYNYLLKSNHKDYHSYVISSNFWIYKLDETTMITETAKWSNKDSPVILAEYDLDKKYPHPIFYGFRQIPKKNKGDFKSGIYGSYNVISRNDTFILTQKYRKENRERKIYFKKDYKIFKLEEFNFSTEESDAYWCVKFHYFNQNCFDSINSRHKLGFYTPSTKREQAPVVKDTVTKSSKFLHVLGDSTIQVNRQKFYLFDYWYLSCGPCIQMMPFMQQLHQNIDTSKIVIIGVNAYDKRDAILSYLHKRNYHFMQLDRLKNIPLHHLDEHPTLILVDGNFNEVWRYKGYGKPTEKDVLGFLRSKGLLRQ